MRRRFVLALALGLAAASVQAQAPATVDVAGVKFPTTLSLGGTTVQLNGAGIRYKAIFKVYAAGLYLAGKASTPEAVIGAAGPKRIHLVMLRALDAQEFGKILSAGIENNASREEFMHALPAIQRMGEASASYKQLVPGDTLTIEWLPATGMTLYVKGKPEVGPYKEPAVFNAMAKIWLGKNPPDATLKDALLGQAPKSQPGPQQQ